MMNQYYGIVDSNGRLFLDAKPCVSDSADDIANDLVNLQYHEPEKGWHVAPVYTTTPPTDALVWIDVKERLPECSLEPNSFGVQVLIWPPYKSGGYSDAYVAFYGCRQTDEPNFYIYGRLIDVEHWMPLPSSPPASKAEGE